MFYVSISISMIAQSEINEYYYYGLALMWEPPQLLHISPSPTSFTSRLLPVEFGYGTIAIVIISLASLVGVIFIPCLNGQLYRDFLAVFIALGVGTLSADAMLHLLPAVSKTSLTHLFTHRPTYLLTYLVISCSTGNMQECNAIA